MAASVTLLESFADLPDPRVRRRRLHPLATVFALAVCAMLGGAEGWDDMVLFARSKEAWFAERIDLSNGVPSADTFRRVFARIDPEAFQARFSRWVQAMAEQMQKHTDGQVIALDGKTLRPSFDTASKQAALHMVSAWASSARLVLASVEVDAKSNAITAVPELLALLDLTGCIVTADAMSCQRAIARPIIEQGGDYVLALKGNQERIHTDVQLFFEHAIAQKFEDTPYHIAREATSEHGRTETRTCIAVDLLALEGRWADVQAHWEGLSSLIMLHSRRQIGAKVTEETRYYLGSVSGNARKVLSAIRRHWGIENSVHWVLDVVFDEDACRIRKDNAPQNLAVMRHIALNLLRHEKSSKSSIKAKQKRAGWDNAYLTRLLSI